MYKINKHYSNTNIGKQLKNITTSGTLEGGKHTIEGIDSLGNKVTFVMLSTGAWRGGKSIYYKCVKIGTKRKLKQNDNS